MTIYIQPGVITIFLLFGLACFLLGLVIGRPDKRGSNYLKLRYVKPIKCKWLRRIRKKICPTIIDEMHDYKPNRAPEPSYKIPVPEKISCNTCKQTNCVKCETEGMYTGFERGDSHV